MLCCIALFPNFAEIMCSLTELYNFKMKTFKYVLFTALFGMGFVPSAFAQESVADVGDIEFVNTNVDENGKKMRVGYLTNPWYSNWSVGLAVGGQRLVSGSGVQHDGRPDWGKSVLTPEFEINITKWFTPVMATRFGLQGFKVKDLVGTADYHQNHFVPKFRELEDGSKEFVYNQTYFHLDVLWNVVNTIWGYKGNRFYNFIPYAHFGYMRLSHPDYPLFTREYRDREIAAGFGLFNTFRISNSVLANVDFRWTAFNGRYHDASNGGLVNDFSASIGLTYNIEKWYWARAKGLEVQRDIARAEAKSALASLNEAMDENASLKRLIDDANAHAKDTVVTCVPARTFRERVENADLIMYYELNVSKANFAELNHLHDFVTATLQNDPKHVFYLTGSADKGTGTFDINTKLSKERAQNVKDILMSKYNVPENQVVIKSTIISDKHEDGGLDRLVLIENQ